MPARRFPHNIGLGATRDPRLVERVARATAEELAGAGVRMPPFVAAIGVGVGSVMIAHSSVDGVAMHANMHLQTDVLRGELGFGGLEGTGSDGEGGRARLGASTVDEALEARTPSVRRVGVVRPSGWGS